MKIDMENYESVLFNLLEGNYSKEEEAALLEEIEKDTFLSFEWENWQKAQLPEESSAYKEKYTTFFEGIKEEGLAATVEKEPVKRVIPLVSWITVAASIVMVFMFNWLNRGPAENSEMAEIETPSAVDIREGNDLSSDQLPTPIRDQEVLVSEIEVPEEVTVKQPNMDTLSNRNVVRKESTPEFVVQEVKELAPLEEPLDVLEMVIDSTQVIPELEIAAVSPERVDSAVRKEEPKAMAVVPKYERKFTVTTENLKRKEVVLSRKEVENASWRKLLEDKRVRLVWVGDKTYLRLESPDEESVLIGLQE